MVLGVVLSGLGAVAQLVFQLVVNLEPSIAKEYLRGSFNYELLALIGFRPYVCGV